MVNFIQNSLLNKNHKRLIIIKSLSKSLGLAGIRVGFCKSSAVLTKLQAVRLVKFATVSPA